MSRFYKIILQQDRKLMLSTNFVQRYGRKLSDFAILELPNGRRTWKIRLHKRTDGEVWFREGWADFSIYYSIGQGAFLLFTYHGKSDGINSHFLVQIFTKKAMEIDYMANRLADSDTSSEEEEEEEAEESIESENSIQTLDEDDFPTNPKTMKPAQQKKMKKTRETDQTTPRSAPNTEFKASTSRGLVRVAKNQLDTKVEAIRKIEASNHKHPLFVVGVQHGYITGKYMYVPNSFIEEHLYHGSIHVDLQTSDGRIWQTVLKPGPKARFSVGWSRFQKENNLKVGDVIVFELVTKYPFSFRVRIY